MVPNLLKILIFQNKKNSILTFTTIDRKYIELNFFFIIIRMTWNFKKILMIFSFDYYEFKINIKKNYLFKLKK